jgi:homoprotocatechuate degradation regulator HpaR
MLSESGISEQKGRGIRVLDEVGPLEQTTLANEACLLLPSLTRMLQSMEEEGLLARAPDETDKRKSIVRITAAGKRVLADHSAASAAIAAELEARYGAEKLETLLDMLDDLTAEQRS